MSILSYRCTEENGLSFELLVDGEPLGRLVGSRDTVFPYSIVDGGLPRYPPFGEPSSPEVCIVCVCNCGEYGCGHTECRVERDGDEIVFYDFAFDVSPEGARKEFRFEAANYDAVCYQIAERALEYRNRVLAKLR